MPARKTRAKSAAKRAADSTAPPNIATTGVVVSTDVVIGESATGTLFRNDTPLLNTAAAAADHLTAATTIDVSHNQPEEPIRSVTTGSTAANVHEERIDEGRVKNPLEVAIANYFNTPSVAEFDDSTSHVYKINDVFDDPYWVEDIQPERFASTFNDGILYRPEIVNEIYDIVALNLLTQPKHGLMIKGPQGIGKSHSIVNVVRKLQSTNKYLVTFIPDCENWRTASNLVKFICNSFGAKYDCLGLSYFKSGVDEAEFEDFIKDVDTILKKENKQWIFVFDQINRIFARFPDKKDIGVLNFPFDRMKFVMSAGRITSIISASANNEISYKSAHSGFLEYMHPINMANEEIETLFPGNYYNEDIYYYTGNVPYYLGKFISATPNVFAGDLSKDVQFHLYKLRKEQSNDWGYYKQNMSMILLKMEFRDPVYHHDKKFFVETYNEIRKLYCYNPLSSIIEDAVSTFFRSDMMEYIEENEAALQNVFNMTETTGDTRGRIFEGLVVRRCMAMGVKLELAGILDNAIVVPEGQNFFSGNALPSSSLLDGVYVPNNSNFPAVDMVWKSGIRIFGVQIHTSKTHKNVFDKFLEMCISAGWMSERENVFLIYLCPFKQCTVLFAPNDSVIEEKDGITIGYITKESLPCLNALQPLTNHWLHN